MTYEKFKFKKKKEIGTVSWYEWNLRKTKMCINAYLFIVILNLWNYFWKTLWTKYQLVENNLNNIILHDLTIGKQ